MPSGITLGTFNDEELLKYETLNALVDAISARFLAGLGSSDIAWPLTAEGNLDMSDYFILGGKKIWNFVNADNYTDLTAAISAAGSGVVIIPPDTTITTSGGDSITGSGATIVGCGPSSILKFAASPSADMIDISAGSGLMISNLTLDGNSAAIPIHNGLVVSGATDVLVSNVWFKNFSGSAVVVGAAANRVSILDCWFTGGSAEHIKVTGCPILNLSNIISTNAGTDGISIASISTAISVSCQNIKIQGAGGIGLKVTGNNAPGTTSPVDFTGSNISIISNTGGNAITLGTAAASLQRVSLSGGRVYGPSAGGILVNASAGSISGVIVDNPATFCVDLDISQKVNVSDCVLLDGTIGIDGSGVGVSCRGVDNVINGCTVEVSSSANFVQYGNGSTISPVGITCFADYTDRTAAIGVTTTVTVFTIPANTLRVGDVMQFSVVYTASGVGTTAADSLAIKFNGNNLGKSTIHGTKQSNMWGEAIVDSLTTIRSANTGLTSYGDVSANKYTVAVADFTIDNDITVVMANPASVEGILSQVVMNIVRSGA